MRLKTRIITGFIMVILIPILMFTAVFTALSMNEKKSRTITTSDSVQEVIYDIEIRESGTGNARVQLMIKDLFFTVLVILFFTSLAGGSWI